ncbi:MAG: RCC1 domain-containing protein [Aristaeellaceae bacterium]
MKLRQKMLLAVLLTTLMLGTIGHAEQSSMIQDVGVRKEGGTQWDCSGRWYATYAEYQGELFDPSVLGENMVLQINQDGTAETFEQGSANAYTWRIEDGCLRLYRGTSLFETCYAIDGHLVSIHGNAVVIFGRSASAEANTPAVIPAASMDAFDGTWHDAYVIKGDVGIPKSLSYFFFGIVIDHGTMTLFFAGDQDKLFQQPSESYRMTLKDGMLYVSDNQYVALHEDGSLSLNTGGEVIYLRKKSPESSTQPEQTTTRVLSGQNTIAVGGYHTAAVREDGTVMAVGSNEYGECDVSGWTDIVAISAGVHHTVGLKADGTVVAAGWNEHGECNVSDWSDIVAISAGCSCTVGLKADDTVVAVGDIWFDQSNVSDWRDIVAVSAGESHIVALKADGTVVALGLNLDGQCNVSDWTDIVAISAGSYHTVGLKADGTVIVIGKWANRYNVSGWTDIAAISAGSSHIVGLKADGTVVAEGPKGCGECDVSGWKDIVAISAGEHHTVGLKADGTVVGVGNNEYSQCDMQP